MCRDQRDTPYSYELPRGMRILKETMLYWMFAEFVVWFIRGSCRVVAAKITCAKPKEPP